MSYQFIHVETYATRRTAAGRWGMREVVAEAMREEGACPHVVEPIVPTFLYGAGDALLAAVDGLDGDAASAVDVLGRKLRKDAQVFLAGVASFPSKVADLKGVAVEFVKWRHRVIEFLKEEYGDCLLAVLCHLDEPSSGHLHFFVRAPKVANSLDLGVMHPGRHAARDRRVPAADRRRLYRDAMAQFQDRYFARVGKPSGMTRVGPKRRRLSREQWQSERDAAAVFAELEELRESNRKRDESLREALLEIGRLKNEHALAAVEPAPHPDGVRTARDAREPLHRRFSPSPF